MVGREESDGLNVAEKKVKNCDDGENEKERIRRRFSE